MAAAPRLPRHLADESWRMEGCGVRCRMLTVTFPGRQFTERVAIHDPLHHEAYGEFVLARNGFILSGRIVATGRLVIDGARGDVLVDGTPIHLTRIELGILSVLAARPGQTCAGREILRAVWGPEYAPESGVTFMSSRTCESHLLRIHISRLRGRLGAARDLVTTVTGMGYRLEQREAVS